MPMLQNSKALNWGKERGVDTTLHLVAISKHLLCAKNSYSNLNRRKLLDQGLTPGIIFFLFLKNINFGDSAMMPGFVRVDSATFYDDIWPQIKDDVEIIESSRANTKKGVRTFIIKWGYKEDIKENIIVAIGRLDATGEKYWVVPTLIQRI